MLMVDENKVEELLNIPLPKDKVYMILPIKDFVMNLLKNASVDPSLYGQCWGCKCEAIKHGHWKRAKAYPNIIICDECGEAFEQRGHWNYCPNCGATMDDDCGRWHKQGDEYRCSECGDTTIVAYKNCPNCGARMDGVKTDEE